MATWYAAQDGVEINTANLWGDDPASPSSYLTWTGSHGGDTFDANGKTITITGVPGGFSFEVGKLCTENAGGQFSVNVASYNVHVMGDVGSVRSSTTVLKITNAGTGILTVTGGISGGSGSSDYGIDPVADNTVVINGAVVGGDNSTAYGVHRCAYGGVTVISGTVTASTGSAIMVSGGSGTATVFSVVAVGIVQATTGYSGLYWIVVNGDIICSSTSTWPLQGQPRLQWDGAATGAKLQFQDSGGGALKEAYVPDYPAEADVKNGVAFDYDNQEGTYNPVASAVYPAEADVWHDTGDYGPNGNDYTPAMVGSDIPNLGPGNVKKDVVIDDVTGTYDPGGGGGIPVFGGHVARRA